MQNQKQKQKQKQSQKPKLSTIDLLGRVEARKKRMEKKRADKQRLREALK